jgi:hypothetical protein
MRDQYDVMAEYGLLEPQCSHDRGMSLPYMALACQMPLTKEAFIIILQDWQKR